MRVLLVLVLLASFACTDVPERVGTPFPPATRPPSAASPADASLFVRACESSVYGDLGPGWRERELSAGPVTFVGARGYADDPARRFSAPGELATSQKVLVVVDGDRPVSVSVRHPDAALAYDPDRWLTRNTVPFRLGYPSTRFEPCAGDDRRATQFNGAFLVRGPACVPVEVRPLGGDPIPLTISFGAGDCA